MNAVANPVDREILTIEKGNQSVTVPDELTILADGETPKPNQVCWRFLSQKDGDKRVVWDAHSIPEINAAKEMFQDLVAQGMTPYRVGADGRSTPEVMDEFDPTAEEVIFMPTKMIAAG